MITEMVGRHITCYSFILASDYDTSLVTETRLRKVDLESKVQWVKNGIKLT